MASPQRENGYTGIANELAEAFGRFPLGSEESRILWFVLRYTYGFQRKSATLAISFLAKATGLKRAAVSRALKKLATKRLLLREKSSVTINKNYDEWVATPRLLATKRLPLLATKRLPKKENIKKTYSPPSGSSEGFQEFWDIYPRKVSKKEALRAWKKLSPSLSVRVRILEAVSRAANSPQWTKDDGRFIPHASTWLNQERWEDETGTEPKKTRVIGDEHKNRLKELGYEP